MKQPPHKRLAAWFLTLVMTLTLLPVGVLALEKADDMIPAKERELSLPDEEAPSISVEITETVAPAVGSQSDAELGLSLHHQRHPARQPCAPCAAETADGRVEGCRGRTERQDQGGCRRQSCFHPVQFCKHMDQNKG